MIAIYEMSFVFGSARTISGDISDAEGDNFAQTTLNSPPIAGTQQQFKAGQDLFTLYCAQCHGENGQGDGPASGKVNGGYIIPVPANFTESGSDFENYGRYVWKAREGVETTNMPPWKFALSDNEIYEAIFYVQSFSTVQDYNAKWAPQYTDAYGRNLKGGPESAGYLTSLGASTTTAMIILSAIALWELKFKQQKIIYEKTKLQSQRNCSSRRFRL